jgi:hypothetical protein
MGGDKNSRVIVWVVVPCKPGLEDIESEPHFEFSNKNRNNMELAQLSVAYGFWYIYSRGF